jgi:regulatory protein
MAAGRPMAGRSSGRRSSAGRSSGSGSSAGGSSVGGARRRARAGGLGREIEATGVAKAGLGWSDDHEVDEPADPESVARLICLRLLTAAPRTRAQLADALSRRGVPADAAESVLSRFAEVGLIDDAMFATSWVESRHYGRGLGRRALAAELRRRGVDRGDIEAAVEQLSDETERATALALVERRLASTTGSSEAARIKKLVGMLARKGYSAGLAYSVVKEAIERAGQDAAGLGDDDGFAFEFGVDDEYSENDQFEQSD